MIQLNYGPISARRVMLGYSKSCEICVFGVESVRSMDSWYVMQWCMTHGYQHLCGTWHFHLFMKLNSEIFSLILYSLLGCFIS